LNQFTSCTLSLQQLTDFLTAVGQKAEKKKQELEALQLTITKEQKDFELKKEYFQRTLAAKQSELSKYEQDITRQKEDMTLLTQEFENLQLRHDQLSSKHNQKLASLEKELENRRIQEENQVANNLKSSKRELKVLQANIERLAPLESTVRRLKAEKEELLAEIEVYRHNKMDLNQESQKLTELCQQYNDSLPNAYHIDPMKKNEDVLVVGILLLFTTYNVCFCLCVCVCVSIDIK